MKLFDLILEKKEYSDTDVIDFNEIDIYHEYNKLNDLLFDGKLSRVPIILNNRKNAHGTVKSTINRRTGEINIQSLSMSKFLNVPYKFFKDVLAHEMIHVSLLQRNINAGHDWRFVREMDRINKMGLGFNISVTTDSSMLDDFEVSTKKNVVLIFCVININGREKYVAVMRENVYTDQGSQISKIFNQTVKSGKYKEVVLEFYKSDEPYLQKLKIQRSFMRSIGYEKIPDERIDGLIEKSIKVSECVILPGKDPQWSGDAPNYSWKLI